MHYMKTNVKILLKVKKEELKEPSIQTLNLKGITYKLLTEANVIVCVHVKY